MNRPVAYLFTTYPVASETFLRREVEAMRGLGVDLHTCSLWAGQVAVDGAPVRRVRRRRLLLDFPWRLGWAVVRRPDVFTDLLREMLDASPPSALNLGENLWGIVCGVLLEGEMRALRPGRIHAVWASMPATSAWLLGRLCGVPWTMGAHAYDVFEHGGDWLLPLKLRSAQRVHCSTAAAQQRVMELGCPQERVVRVRRGLVRFPAFKKLRPVRHPLRIVSVGRLVEKKGYGDLLTLCSHWQAAGLRFELRIVGGGPCEAALRADIGRSRLADAVQLTGPLDGPGVEQQLAWADVFVFTGRIARSGDRDGFPNAIGEAMAAGLPVVATPVGAVPEVIEDGATGRLLPVDCASESTTATSAAAWLDALRRLQSDDAHCEHLRRAARTWVETHFDARKNAQTLMSALEA